MSAVSYAITRQTTQQTNTSTTTWSDLAEITSGNFVAGETYLIIANCWTTIGNNAGTLPEVRLVHGSTPTEFDGSRYKFRYSTIDTYKCYDHWEIWVAVSGESVKMQHLSTSASRTQKTDQISLIAIRLTGEGLTQGTDWDSPTPYTTLTNLTTSYQAGASLTFTPTNNNDSWLVHTCARTTVITTGIDTISRISESRGATTTPQSRQRNHNASHIQMHAALRVFTLANSSGTIKEECALSATGAAGDDRTHSRLFVLRLQAFKDILTAYTDGTVALGTASDYVTNVQTGTFTITATGDALTLGTCQAEPNATATYTKWRQQVNPDGAGLVDKPGTITTDAYQQCIGQGSADEMPVHYADVVNYTSGAGRTVNLDGSAQSGASADGRCRQIAVFSMELAAVSDTGVAQPFSDHTLPASAFRRPVPVPY